MASEPNEKMLHAVTFFKFVKLKNIKNYGPRICPDSRS